MLDNQEMTAAIIKHAVWLGISGVAIIIAVILAIYGWASAPTDDSEQLSAIAWLLIIIGLLILAGNTYWILIATYAPLMYK